MKPSNVLICVVCFEDLVKFLLDTGEFAVVHDMIGLVSELHNLTTIVESKCDAPLPMVSVRGHFHF